MAHSNLSKKYWFDAVSTSVYLINRLSTCVLENASPYEKLYTLAPNYNLLKCFGCTCYPYLRPYTATKLAYCTTNTEISSGDRRCEEAPQVQARNRSPSRDQEVPKEHRVIDPKAAIPMARTRDSTGFENRSEVPE
ncbi:hypothetical protein HHK36_026322 [Tetracentron sinense]|uniref:Uncharacterized protein n=1 Tax=Tetracentron sinense TaxID=13715 RepID=A0A834YJ82_TETSI|nr:hypothetical protein HHK36_026322 [Tetracentron sinense]